VLSGVIADLQVRFLLWFVEIIVGL